MKKFLLKLLINILIVATVVLALKVISTYKSHRILRNLIKDHKVLIMGDSHAQAGFNPSLIKGAINIAHYDESYLFSYYKLKKISRYNNNIETIILSFSYHNLSGYFEEFNNERFSSSAISYLSYLDTEGLLAFSGNDYFKMIKMYFHKVRHDISKLLLLKNGRHSSLEDIEPWGGFHISNRNNLETPVLNKAILKHYHSPQQFSINQIKYLNKIVKYCHESNIDLILVHTPKHYKYKECVTEDFKIEYNNTINSFFNKVTFIDGLNYELTNSDFGDFDHLNSSGANIFTSHLIKINTKLFEN